MRHFTGAVGLVIVALILAYSMAAPSHRSLPRPAWVAETAAPASVVAAGARVVVWERPARSGHQAAGKSMHV